MLPRNAREFVSDHPVESDDDEEFKEDDENLNSESQSSSETTEDADVDALGWAFLAAMSS